jgi:type IV secretory pathway VirB2 component (pilin)
MTARRPLSTTALVALALVLSASGAFAQVAVGGGGNSLMAPVTTWFMQNIAQGLLDIGIIAIGIMLLFLQFRLMFVGMFVCGALVLVNHTTIQALFPVLS